MIKKRIFAGLLALSLLSFAACGQSDDSTGTSGNNDSDVITITLSTSGTTAPFTYTDDDNNVIGYDIDVARAVFERLPQYELKIEAMELHSTLAALDAGRCQMSANNWNKTSEREEKYFFSDPILDCKYSAIFASDRDVSSVSSLSDLAGQSTIVTSGSNVSVILEDYNEQNPDKTIEINYSDEDFAKMAQDIQDGLYDFVLYPEVMYIIYKNTYNFDLKAVEVGTELTDSLFNGNPYAYFIISKDNEQLLEDVNEALAEIQLDGTVQKISETYFGADYSASEWYTSAN